MDTQYVNSDDFDFIDLDAISDVPSPKLPKQEPNTLAYEPLQYPPLKPQKRTPYKGDLTQHPDDIVFATWMDYLSYRESWSQLDNKRPHVPKTKAKRKKLVC